MKWQPIETAPKDGTYVLVTGGAINYGWEDDEHPRAVSARWEEKHRGGCWHFAWYDGGYYGEYECPTHWIPLPPPPEAE